MRKRFCVMAMAAALTLTGCAGSVPELSTDNNNMIAEYMAGDLLKYSADYTDSLDYDRRILDATPSPTPTIAPVSTEAPASSAMPAASSGAVSSTDIQETAVESVSYSDLLGLSDVSVKAVSYKKSSSFGSSYSAVTASKGQKLVIVSFKIKNKASSSKKVNLMKKKINYTLQIDDESYGSPLLTIAEGDMQYFNEKVNGGKSKNGILVFEVSSKVKVKNVVLKAAKGNKEASIEL